MPTFLKLTTFNIIIEAGAVSLVYKQLLMILVDTVQTESESLELIENVVPS
jgi:hypothetical protein